MKKIKEAQIKKVDIVDHCMRILKAAEEEAELKSIKLNEEFARHFKHVLKYCDDEREDLDNLDNQESDLLTEITTLEDKLIEIEMLL